MALSAKVGAFNTGTGTSDVTVTGVGFQPAALILWWSGRAGTANASGRATAQFGIGFANGTSITNYAAAVGIADNQATTDSGRRTGNTYSVILSDSTGANAGSGRISAVSADGFTFHPVTAFATDLRVHYLALGGTDLASVAAGDFLQPAATGTQDITVGFQPDIVFFSTAITSAAAGTGSSATLSLGAAISASEQFTLAINSRDARASTSAWHNQTGAECISFLASGAVSGRATFSQMLADGFRINWLEVGTNAYIYYLALAGNGSFKVGSIATSTGSSNQAETGVGFQPKAALVAGSFSGSGTQDTAAANTEWSLGAFTGASERGVQAVMDYNGVAPSQVSTALRHDAFAAGLNADGTLGYLVDLVSTGADGFTYVMDDTDTAAHELWYVAFGDAGAAARTGSLSATLAGLTRSAAGGILDHGAFSQSLATLSPLLFGSVQAVTFQRPASDLTPGAWTLQDGSGVNLYSAADETSLNAGDFIRSVPSPDGEVLVLGLSPGVDPQSSTGHVLRYAIGKDLPGTEVLNMTVQLRQGYVSEGAPGALIAEWTHSDLGSLATFEQALSGAQADSITDYTALAVRIVATLV